QLDEQGQRLRSFHLIEETAERRPLRPRLSMLIETPPGHRIDLSRTQSLFGAMNLELLHHVPPPEDSQQSAWVLNARHAGVEIATILSGSLRLVITERRVESSSQLDPATASLDGIRVVDDRVLKAGQTTVFPSGFWHHA